LPHLFGGIDDVSSMPRVMSETDGCKLDGIGCESLRSNRCEVPAHDDLLGFAKPLCQQRRRDSALINIEKRYIAVGDLVKEDDELDQVCVGLLPERFISAAKQIVQ